MALTAGPIKGILVTSNLKLLFHATVALSRLVIEAEKSAMISARDLAELLQELDKRPASQSGIPAIEFRACGRGSLRPFL
jgi:hypothetical protein